MQVRRTGDGRNTLDPQDASSVRLIRLWANALVSQPERFIQYAKLGAEGTWQNYLDLRHVRQQNNDLHQIVDRLRLEQAALLEDARQGQRLQELLGFQQRYIYSTVAAQAIGSSGSDQSRVFYLDKGSADGLDRDMAVITADGIVGKVREVFPHSAQVLAISDQTQDNHQSIIYVLPLAGGTPRRVTAKAPSYFHGWSPDGKTLAFCGQRDGEFDIYTIPAEGGEETRLTTAPGLDDGPEYSPGGEYIYFNSERTGTMQIWRMKPDGTDQKQVTNDEYNNWFAHPSPDGKQLVFLSYEKDVKGHPENKDVMLRLITLADGKITVLARLFGGQGTINTPSWSPDGRRLAFVSYQLQ